MDLTQIRGNPWAKKTLNLTRQMQIQNADPELARKMEQEALALDTAEHRKTHNRTVAEFNEMDKEGKIRFINSGGEII